ncbi:DUF6207 family protein [Streptomyces olivochromogenes]|uniref:DUF6207 family protein n=1 Tax=Streptomyces olivochromogenes TaxID=1963 RepID=UPI0036D7DFD7
MGCRAANQREPSTAEPFEPHPAPLGGSTIRRAHRIPQNNVGSLFQPAASAGQLAAGQWATATADRTTRDAGQPGVRLRCFLDLRQPVDL